MVVAEAEITAVGAVATTTGDHMVVVVVAATTLAEDLAGAADIMAAVGITAVDITAGSIEVTVAAIVMVMAAIVAGSGVITIVFAAAGK
ncbi:MAG: hypothetical protein JWO15_3286 [Sphingomonadales bacterium]|nr:hypothetical protein [Sphingomonadales bacterium]